MIFYGLCLWLYNRSLISIIIIHLVYFLLLHLVAGVCKIADSLPKRHIYQHQIISMHVILFKGGDCNVETVSVTSARCSVSCREVILMVAPSYCCCWSKGGGLEFVNGLELYWVSRNRLKVKVTSCPFSPSNVVETGQEGLTSKWTGWEIEGRDCRGRGVLVGEVGIRGGRANYFLHKTCLTHVVSAERSSQEVSES